MSVPRDAAPAGLTDAPAPDAQAASGASAASAAQALERALVSAAPEEPALREAVAAFVAAAKARTAPPEAVLVALKARVRDYAYARLDPERYEALMARAVAWALDAYYGPRAE